MIFQILYLNIFVIDFVICCLRAYNVPIAYSLCANTLQNWQNNIYPSIHKTCLHICSFSLPFFSSFTEPENEPIRELRFNSAFCFIHSFNSREKPLLDFFSLTSVPHNICCICWKIKFVHVAPLIALFSDQDDYIFLFDIYVVIW